MNTPTIAYGATTIDLGFPVGRPDREIQEQSQTRRTLGGILRSSVLSWNYAYSLRFTVLTTTYDSLVTLRNTAIAAGAPLVFDFSDLWPSATDVDVWAEIGPLAWDVPGADAGTFDLTLTEVDPR